MNLFALDLPHRNCHQNINPVVIRMDSPVSFLSIKHDTEAVRTSLMWEVTRSTGLSIRMNRTFLSSEKKLQEGSVPETRLSCS